MRRLFIILFVLLASISAFSQADDTTKYIKYPGVYGIQYPRYMATKVLRPPVDTIYSKSGLAIIGAVLYYGDGVRWRASAAGGSGTVTSVGLSMPSGFSVTGSPVTGSGTLAVTGAGTTGQVILGDGSLGTFNPWNRNGNSGTTVGTDFFGTTDDESLMLKVNNVEAGYLRSIVTGYNNAPGGGLTSYGQYALDTLLERILSGYTLGVNNTAVGFKAGAHFGSKMDGDIAASDENVAVGNLSMFWTAGVSSGYSKGRNTAVGQSTLFRNISGSYNVAIGIFALEDNNKGDANTAVGDGALRSNIDGDFNAAVGGSAMVYNSTGVINCTIVSGGLGYSVGDTITFSAPLSNGPGTCYGVAGGRVLTVDGSGTITSVEIPTPGCGYSSRGGTFANMAYHPPVTATVGGAGSGASLTPVLSSGSRNTALGILAGAYNVLGQDMIYVGYGSGTGARQWDRKSTFIGVGSGIDASVSAVDSIDKAITIGYGATTTCDNCAVIGGTGSNAVRLGMGTITPAASSILDLTSTTQGVLIPRMTSAQRTAIGSPATGLMVWDTDQARLYNYGGLSWLPYAYSNEWGTSAGTTGTKHYIPMWNGSDDFIDSRMMEITNGTGDFISIDDNQTGSTTTNNFLFNVRNSYAGDATASTNPLVFFGSNSSSISILPILKMQASNMPTSSSIMYGIGKTSATKNMYFGSFQYNSNGGNDNYFEHQFAGSANQGRMYTSGNWTIGSSVTADNGYKLEVGGSIRNHSFWETADISLPSTPGSGFGRVFVRTDSLRFVNDVGTEFTLGASAGATGLTVGTTTITSGTDGRILRNNAGVLGEYTVTGSGTEAVLSTSPTFVTSITSPIVYGSSAANGDLNLNGTSNGTTATSSVNIQASGGNVGIGTISPDSVFQVNGSLKFVTGRQGAGKVLTSDANGGADWVTPSTGSGTVNTGIANKAAYYPSGGTTVDDVAGAEFNGTNKILQLTAQAATDVPLTITPHGSQSANLLNIGTLVNWNNNGDQYVEDRQVYYKYTGNIKGGWHPTQIGFIVTPGQGYGFSDADNFNTIDGSIMRSGAGVLKVIAGGLGVTTKGDLEVLNEAYNATTWNGSEEVPTKDAVRDKIEAILSPDYSRLVKTLNVNVTDAGNVGTGEDDLMSFTVPADTLSTNGDYIDFEMTVTFAANSNNKNVKLYWGGTQFYTTGAAAQNSGNMIFRGKIIRTGATTQKIMLTQASNTLSFVDETTNTTGSATLSSANILKATGEATSNNDIVQTSLTVVFNRNH